MASLANLLLIANPVATLLLSVLVFFESKKNRSQLISIELALKESSKTIIESVERQKDGFNSISESLSLIATDQETMADRFSGISDALLKSSTTNDQALKGVISALENATDKFKKDSESVTSSINKNSEELNKISSTLKSIVSI